MRHSMIRPDGKDCLVEEMDVERLEAKGWKNVGPYDPPAAEKRPDDSEAGEQASGATVDGETLPPAAEGKSQDVSAFVKPDRQSAAPAAKPRPRKPAK